MVKHLTANFQNLTTTINSYHYYLRAMDKKIDPEVTQTWQLAQILLKLPTIISIVLSMMIILHSHSCRKPKIALFSLLLLPVAFYGFTWKILKMVVNPILPLLIEILLNAFWAFIGYKYFAIIELKDRRSLQNEMDRIANFFGHGRPGYNPIQIYFCNDSATTKDPYRSVIEKDKEILESGLNTRQKAGEMMERIDFFWGYCFSKYLIYRLLTAIIFVLLIYFEERTRVGFLIRFTPILFTLSLCSAFLDDVVHNASEKRPTQFLRATSFLYIVPLHYGWFFWWRIALSWAIRLLL